MSEFKEYKPMEVEYNVKAAVENLRKAYWSNETGKVAKHYTEAEDKIISAICHHHYTVCKETTEGDLISREALKEAISYHCEYLHDSIMDLEDILNLIDNAPAVPERDYSQGWHDAITKALNEAYTITTEDGSFKVVQTETLEGLGMSMPDKKGEWKLVYKGDESHSANYECSICQREIYFDAKTESLTDYPFCHCGAKMKGGAE